MRYSHYNTEQSWVKEVAEDCICFNLSVTATTGNPEQTEITMVTAQGGRIISREVSAELMADGFGGPSRDDENALRWTVVMTLHNSQAH